MAQPGLSVVIKHLKKSRHRAWMMPRTRLASDSLSYLRAGWSAASGRLNGVRSGDCRSDQSQHLSGAQLPRAAAAIQLMPPCRLPFSRTAKGGGNGRGDRADGAGAGIGLPVDGCHPTGGDRPGDEIAVQCLGCLRYSPCPGLSKCRARLVLADGCNTAAALLPRTGGSRVHQLSGATLPPAAHSKRPPSTRQVPPPLLFSLARPSVGESIGRVLCSWRLDEIEARFWRAPPGGCVAASQSGSIRTV